MHVPNRHRVDLLHSLRQQIRTMQNERRYREGMVGGQVGWVLYEQLHLWGCVNEHREHHDRQPLPFEEVQAVERMASGHSDYTDKLALYCMELVLLRA